jgi:acyl-CoA synthetase (AMP-forming)/AMP-acid ligase II
LEVEALAGWLQQRAGVKSGDRVLLDMQNSPQFIIAYYAIARANAVIVPISPMNLTAELHVILTDCGATVAIAGGELFDRVQPLVGDPLTHVIIAAYSDYLERETTIDLPPAVAAPRANLTDAGPHVTAFADTLAARLTPGPMTAHGEDMLLLPYTPGRRENPRAVCTLTIRCKPRPGRRGIGSASACPARAFFGAAILSRHRHDGRHEQRAFGRRNDRDDDPLGSGDGLTSHRTP